MKDTATASKPNKSQAPLPTITQQTIALIDRLKSICATQGLGNDAGEYRVITQLFLYKFLSDRFTHQARHTREKLQALSQEALHAALESMSKEDYALLLDDMGAEVLFQPEELLPSLYRACNERDFHKRLDSALEALSTNNLAIFSIKTDEGSKIKLFEPISSIIADPSKRDNFAKALISSLLDFDFCEVFDRGYDFFAPLFEYLIKDYNKDNGGKYAEYYTPHSVSSIMARILVGNSKPKSVSLYDPSAGSGTLLMSLAHTIGQDSCSLYAQDISQKSSQLLRLNLILNKLTHSIANITQGNTLTHPAHTDKHFDFIVSNPPFKLDFSEYRAELDTQKQRFFAGVPNIPTKKKESMAIYLCFFQHLLHSLSPTGRAAIVVPTGFITATSKIEKSIRKALIDSKSLSGCITMPPNIFATTGTNVSVVFIDRSKQFERALLIDASKLGEKQKVEKNERVILSKEDEEQIIHSFLEHKELEDFSIQVPLESIARKNYSFAAGQYFDFRIEHTPLSKEEFAASLESSQQTLQDLFTQSNALQQQIMENFSRLFYKE